MANGPGPARHLFVNKVVLEHSCNFIYILSMAAFVLATIAELSSYHSNSMIHKT